MVTQHELDSKVMLLNESLRFFQVVLYYDHKITFIFSSDFETVLTKHSPNEILSLNFKKTVYLNAIFRFNGAPLLYQKLIQGRHSLTSFRIQSVNTTY